MLDDALWNANNVHVPAATLHHAVPGTRPSFSGREAHAVPVRAGSLEVGLVGRNRVVLPHTLALSFSHRKTFRNRPLQPLRAALQPRWPKQRQACVLKADISANRRRHAVRMPSLFYGYFIYFMEQQ